ncbi:MAG: hypothetical protein ACK5PQ_02720 [Alphaproteobacteria bacterium]
MNILYQLFLIALLFTNNIYAVVLHNLTDSGEHIEAATATASSARVAKDELFNPCGIVCTASESSQESLSIFSRGQSVLVSSQIALTARHVVEGWKSNSPDRQFYVGFNNGIGVDLSLIKVKKVLCFKGQDIAALLLEEPVDIQPAEIITQEECKTVLSNLNPQSKENPFSCMYASYSIPQHTSGLIEKGTKESSLSISTSLEKDPDQSSFIKQAGAIYLSELITEKGYTGDEESFLVSDLFIPTSPFSPVACSKDFFRDQSPILYKDSSLCISNIGKGDSGSGLFCQINRKWKLIGIASKIRHFDLYDDLGAILAKTYWSSIRLKEDRLEKAIEALLKS